MHFDHPGRFLVPQTLLESELKFQRVRELMAGMFIIRAEYMFAYQAFEYQADSPEHFDRGEDGLIIPTYELQTDDVKYSFRRVT